MPHFVKVTEQGYIKEFWDSVPPVPVGTDGWRIAEFVIPSVDCSKQSLGDITFDLTKDPVFVTYDVITYNVEERKQFLLLTNESNFSKIIELIDKAQGLVTTEELRDLKTKASNNKVAIENCNTHEELDNLRLETISVI